MRVGLKNGAVGATPWRSRGSTGRRARVAPLPAALLLSAVLWGVPGQAQIAVEPGEVRVTAAQYANEMQALVLTNEGSEPTAYCLAFERPLEGEPGRRRIAADAVGGACGPYGAVLARIDGVDVPDYMDAYGLAMTPEGRLFVADYSRGVSRTHELTADLTFIRSFPHPVEKELDWNPATTGVTYDPGAGTLWWLNIETTIVDHKGVLLRALLLEGALDGTPTGRRIELPAEGDDVLVGLAYDRATGRFYYAEIWEDEVWAVDTLGRLVPGYPVPLAAYPGRQMGFGLDAHRVGGDESPEGLRVEAATDAASTPGELRRLVVAGVLGEDTAPGGAPPLETPLPYPNPGGETGTMTGEPLRSRVDPGGVVYTAFSGYDRYGVLALRAHPLPPTWLVVGAGGVGAWRGTLGAGERREVALSFRPGGRAVGAYGAVLQVFEAETGEAVEVPLVLEVVPGVGAEEGVTPAEDSRLAVYPNPARGAATVALTLAEASEVRVVVYDVLGRTVAVLADGPFGTGEHTLSFEVTERPSGVYVVRVESGAFTGVQRVMVLR